MKRGIYIGELIHKELRKKERSVSWLAEKVHCDRSNFYRILTKAHIDCGLLLRISLVLDCDFFIYYSSLIKKIKKEQ